MSIDSWDPQDSDGATREKVSLLSSEEVRSLDLKREVGEGIAVDPEGHRGCWWLRSPTLGPACVATVGADGYLADDGDYYPAGFVMLGGVRPVLWLNLESSIPNTAARRCDEDS
ncbi:MAG: DUF6273 domain-containing protein [Micrococcales bacterium]|nr:DUF6273 domain-containing protein [Micrococcales bacterium]